MKRRTYKRRAVTAVAGLGLALLLAVGLAACGSTPAEDSSSPASADTPKQGGTLTLSYLTEPSSLDPAVAWNVIDWQIEHDIYQGFLQYAHESGAAGTELIPCLATEVPSTDNGGISADGKTYTFHLREGVKFQPPVSREVTAADFKYSFERMMKEPRAPATSFYMGVVGADEFMKDKADEITGFKAVDDYTVEITLKSPDLSFLNAVTMDFCDVVPKEWVEKWGKQFNRNPLGTGPFVFQKWTPGREIVLTRNPDYWEDGRPYLDGVNYQLSFNPPTALLKLERGEVDVLGDGIPVADLPRVQADPKWKAQIFTQPLVAISYMFMNVGHEAVRRRQGAPGAQLGDQPRQAREAAGRPGDVAVAVLSQGHARPRGGQGLLRLRPGQGEAATRRRRLPGRLQDDAVHRQRRPEPQALAVGAGRPRRGGRQGRAQDDEQQQLLHRSRARPRRSPPAASAGGWTSPTRATGSRRCSARPAPSRAA